MTEKKAPGWLNMALEYGPTLVFFILYTQIRDDTFTVLGRDYSGFIVASLVFVPILLTSMAVLWHLTGKLSRIQILTAIMVIVFGGLTAWFNDERFFKIKTSIIYGLMAATLTLGLILKKNWLQFLMGELLPMQDAGWTMLTRRLIYMFVALAIANEIIWRNFSTDMWVKLETFGMPAALIVFLWAQIFSLRRFMIDESDSKEP